MKLNISYIAIITTFIIHMQCGLFGSENHAPEIVSITATPSTVPAGSSQTSTLSVVATDEDGDDLTYTWNAEHGWLTGAGRTVVWHHRHIVYDYSIECIVSDGKATVKESVIVKVVE